MAAFSPILINHTLNKMKKKLSKEPDLYVINKKPTEKELQEFREFIEEYKKKKAKHRKAA